MTQKKKYIFNLIKSKSINHSIFNNNYIKEGLQYTSNKQSSIQMTNNMSLVNYPVELRIAQAPC